MTHYHHVPVLFQEVLTLLQPQPNGRYIDGTVGTGGHTAGLLEKSAPTGRVLALDKDPEAVQYAQQQLAIYGDRVLLLHASYAEMGTLAPQHGFSQPDGILLDLGLSSRQLDNRERGFSLMQEGPLDMRFDPTQGATAADLVNNLSEAELVDLIWKYGEDTNSRKIARLIVAQRPFTTTTQLAQAIAAQVRTRKRIHPATQTFQALRIAVNQELQAVETGVLAAIELLKPNGRLAIISFHSLEDRFVKETFRRLSTDHTPPPGFPASTHDGPPIVTRITRKAIQATENEIQQNPRSRSARLRVIEKL
jgi:16S rRNA (cytosine1402-N4)-methyltransferase